MTRRPRVLFLSLRCLFPLDTGGKIRSAKILAALRPRWDVTLVSPLDPGAGEDGRREMEALATRLVPVARKPRNRGLRRLLGAWRRAFSGLPQSVIDTQSDAMSAAVAEELTRGHALLVCDFVQSAINVPAQVPCATLLFTHNVESRITRRHRELASSPLMRAWWAIEHRRMERFEREAVRRFDRVIAVSDDDRREFESRFGVAGVRAIPTGVDTDYFRPRDETRDPDAIVFCGSMDWAPNQDAVAWFAGEVLPSVRRAAHPRAFLTVVGRAAPSAFRRRLEGDGAVRFTGWVEDVRPWIARAACCVVPLRIGGGTRIKIYEALAMDAAVVSTTVGVEGLPLEPQAHFLLADTPRAFAEAVLRCLQQPEVAREIGRRGGSLVRSRFGWPVAADAFAAVGEEAIEAHRGDP